MDDSPSTRTTVAVDPRHINYTQIIYALHATSVALALLSSASIVRQFVFSAPSIIAVVMNYARRSQVRGTWLDSHFSWQLRTFWAAFIILVCMWPLVLTFILIPVVWMLYGITGLWVIYRIVRGWLALKDGRTLPGSWL